MKGRLDAAQRAVLDAIATVDVGATLTGGGALVAVHLGHRTTRDLDLFWHGSSALGGEEQALTDVLTGAGLSVRTLQRSPAFVRLDVSTAAGERTRVDLVAEPVPSASPPIRVPWGAGSLRVDPPHEILVNKLNALLSRSELRDLVDVSALLDAGGDLPAALVDATKKDGGFSPLTLAWVLESLPIEVLAERLGWPAAEANALVAFRSGLVERLTALS